MAAIIPTQLFPGYEQVASGGTVAADSIVIPLSALGGLTAAEADEATGDGRKVAFELAKAMHTNIQGLAENARPAQMLTSESTPTGQGPNEVRKSYTMTFDVNIGSVDVADEPA